MAKEDEDVGTEDNLELDLDLEEIEGEEETVPETDDGKEPSKKETPESDPEELSETEKIAYAQGWRPKKDFVAAGNDPKAWKEAAWWMDRGELLGQQSALRKEVKQIKEAFIRMTEYNRQAYIKGQEDGIKRMKDERKAALREGALDVVADLEDRIDEASQTLTTVQNTKTDVLPDAPQDRTADTANHPAYKAWIAANTWYQQNEEAFDFTNATAARFAKANPTADIGVALAHVTEKVKARFPELFSGPKRVSQPSVGGRGAPTASQGSSGSVDGRFAKIVAQMDPDSRRAVVDMIRSGNITKKEYVDSYVD